MPLDVRRRVGETAAPIAFTADEAEQRLDPPIPRHLSELVHRCDEHRRTLQVDLLVYYQDGKPNVAARFREWTPLPWAGNPRSGSLTIRPVVMGRKRLAAPRAGLELARVRSLLGWVLLDSRQGAPGLVVGVRRTLHPKPQSDAEAVVTPELGVLRPQHLASAKQGCRALELLDCEQPECVPHEHGKAGVCPHARDRASPPQCHGECRKSQICLRFPSPGGEPQEVPDTPVIALDVY